MGPGPIGWGDIAAFVSLSGVRLAPWEIDVIEDLDDIWLMAQNGLSDDDPTDDESN